MQREECIFNLIPRPVAPEKKAPRYQSKHDPMVQPTGSTFGIHGKTKLLGANLGDAKRVERPASAKGFGKLAPKPDPKGFTKKGERCSTDVDAKKLRAFVLCCRIFADLLNADLANFSALVAAKFSYSGQTRPAVVTRDDKPIMGLKSAKNFVTANAVEAILAVPGTRAPAKNDPPQYRNKEDYGKVPRYLSQVKDEIERENMLIEEFVRQNQQLMDDADGAVAEPMDERERQELVNALKAKWDHVNAKYQKLCHNVVFDTLGKVRRKETFEKELTQLEKDITLLEKGRVVVVGNQ